MKPKIYIETSIPSFYHEIRTEPEMVARRDWTRQFWDEFSGNYSLVTSIAVLDELNRGEHPNKSKCLELIEDIPLVLVEPEITAIVQAYIQRKVMPDNPVGDALHLALASFHKCDFLLTWNCKHLANANKFGHIRRINALLNLYNPSLVTPLELLGEPNETNE